VTFTEDMKRMRHLLTYISLPIVNWKTRSRDINGGNDGMNSSLMVLISQTNVFEVKLHTK
jgi:hypothetical protein